MTTCSRRNQEVRALLCFCSVSLDVDGLPLFVAAGASSVAGLSAPFLSNAQMMHGICDMVRDSKTHQWNRKNMQTRRATDSEGKANDMAALIRPLAGGMNLWPSPHSYSSPKQTEFGGGLLPLSRCTDGYKQ